MTATLNHIQTKLSKSEILDRIATDDVFSKIISLYKDNGLSGTKYHLDFDKYSGANGLLPNIYVIHKNDIIVDIIVPIFTTEKTSTWNFSYNQIIVDTISADFKLNISDVTKIAKCLIYYLDKYDSDVTFLTLLKVDDFISNGFKGQNGKSVYFWNDKLPNKWSLYLKDLEGDLFVNTLHFMNDKELKSYCKKYAEDKYDQFGDLANKRGSKTKISNISSGVYEQLKLYRKLKTDGYSVNMYWLDKDDYGVDIQLETNNTTINIDVKSTKDEFLKISKFRKETDFYAIVQNGEFLGFINKFEFWSSNITGSKEPNKNEKTGMFFKKLTKKWQKEFLSADELFNDLVEYRKKKMKRKATLFDK